MPLLVATGPALIFPKPSSLNTRTGSNGVDRQSLNVAPVPVVVLLS